MLNSILLTEVQGSDPGFRSALVAAHLPAENIEEEGRTFFKAISDEGQTGGYSGIELCAYDLLLRSVVVLPEHRGNGLGQAIVEATLQSLDCSGDVYLATTTAAPFFSNLGFSEVARDNVPEAVLSTQQLSGLCPSSATIMKLNRPPA